MINESIVKSSVRDMSGMDKMLRPWRGWACYGAGCACQRSGMSARGWGGGGIIISGKGPRI